MTYVAIARSEPVEKIVDGSNKQVTPIVFAGLGEGNLHKMFGVKGDFGVGYEDGNGRAMLWGVVCPQSLMQSWRAMKLLEGTRRIESSTLSHCWHVAAKKIHNGDLDKYRKLAEDYDPDVSDAWKKDHSADKERPYIHTLKNKPKTELGISLAKALKVWPTEQEFSAMLDKVVRFGIVSVADEILAAVKDGKLPQLPQLKELSRLSEEAKESAKAHMDASP